MVWLVESGFACLCRGYFSENADRIELSPNGPVMALNIPAGQWHTVQALESGTLILEMKNGKYVPLGEEDMLKL